MPERPEAYARALRKKVRRASALEKEWKDGKRELNDEQRQSVRRLAKLSEQLAALEGWDAVEEERQAGSGHKANAEQMREKRRAKRHEKAKKAKALYDSGAAEPGPGDDAVRKQIAKADSVSTIHRLATQRHLHVDTLAFALNAALRRLSGNSAMANDRAAAAALVAAIARRSGELTSARTVTSALGDAAKLAALPRAPALPALASILTAVEKQVPSLDPRGAAGAIYAVGKLLDAKASPPSAQSLLRSLEAALPALAPRFNARDVSATLWGLAKAHARGTPAATRAAVANAVAATADDLKGMPQELAMTSWGLATLASDWERDAPEDDATLAKAAEALERAMEGCATAMSAQALATCLWSIARWHCGGARSLGPATKRIVDIDALPSTAKRSARAMHACALTTAASFDARQSAMAASASVRIGLPVNRLLAVAARQSSATLTDLSEMLWAAGVGVGGLSRDEDRAWVDALLDTALACIASPDWQEIGRLDYARHALDGVASDQRLCALGTALRRAAGAALEAVIKGARTGDDAADAALAKLVSGRGGWESALCGGNEAILVGGRGAQAAATALAGRRVHRWRTFSEGPDQGSFAPPVGTYGAAVLRLPAARAAAACAIAHCAAVLPKGAPLLCYGAIAEGGSGVLREVHGVREVERVDIPGGFAVALERTSEAMSTPNDAMDFVKMTVSKLGGGSSQLQNKRFCTAPGLFAGGRADAMTDALVRSLPSRPPRNAAVLDLGCGAGAVAYALAHAGRKRGVRVFASDADPRAVAAARENLPNATVLLGDTWHALAGVGEKHFAWIVSNPPVHNGASTDFSVVCELLRGSSEYLTTDGGLLFVVVQSYVPFAFIAEMHAPRLRLTCLSSDGQFTVWRLRHSNKRKAREL